jgi:hypothetical protein
VLQEIMHDDLKPGQKNLNEWAINKIRKL